MDSVLQVLIAALKTPSGIGFNPCFGGFCTSGVNGITVRSRVEEFQSLFWWILYFRIHFQSESGLQLRFNPCFGGFGTSGSLSMVSMF